MKHFIKLTFFSGDLILLPVEDIIYVKREQNSGGVLRTIIHSDNEGNFIVRESLEEILEKIDAAYENWN